MASISPDLTENARRFFFRSARGECCSVFVLKLKCSLCACPLSPVHASFPSPHTCVLIFFLCDTAQELLLPAVLQRLGTPRVPHILQQILLLQVSSLLPFIPPLSLSAASLSYVRQRVLIKRSTAGYQRCSGWAAFCVSLSASLSPSLSLSPSFSPSLSPSLCACVCALLCSLHY